ncbi:hypothetical protein V491_09196 [Pseudogymnoascus sp. VKM F-3775]|nr:hypothetical protein V491_09196 [Pseudogymnoascus sp. VKM F-3775]
MLYREQYTDDGLLSGTVPVKAGPGPPRQNVMYNKVKLPGEVGALKSLVSKFENLASANSNGREKAPREPIELEKVKEKGWRTVVVLRRRLRGSIEEKSQGSLLETHSPEAKKVSSVNRAGLESFVEDHNKTSPIVRGREEGQKWRDGFGIQSESIGLQISPFEMDRNIEAGTDASLTLKTEHSGERKESLIQMRIRLLEQSQKPQQQHNPDVQKERKIVKLEGSSNTEPTSTPTGTKAGRVRSGSKERGGAELHEPHPHLASGYPKSLKLSKPATDITAVSITGAEVSLEKHALCSVKQKFETTAEFESETQQESIESTALQVPYNSLETRNIKETSPKGLAPIIQERIKMFESTRDGRNGNLAVLDEPSGCTRARVDDKGKTKHESGGERFLGIKEVVGEEQVKAARPRRTPNPSNKTKSAFSQCLAERTRSRTGCTVDGKYVSAFAYRRKAQRTSASTSWVITAASRESESTDLNDNPINQASSGSIDRPDGMTCQYMPQPSSEQQSNSSRLPISSSLYSGSRPNTLSDWSNDSHDASSRPPTTRSIPSASEGIMAQSRDSTDALPRARNLRISEIINMASEREVAAASRRIVQGYTGRNFVESKGVGAWLDSESSSGGDEEGTLIVKSVAKLREPKPLRITEVSSLAKICRLGRSRGDLE